MQGRRDESRNQEAREKGREFRDGLIYELLFLNRDVFGDFTEMSPIWSSHTHTHTHTHTHAHTHTRAHAGDTRDTCNSKTSHSVGRML